jgi:hypothetical protein
MIRPLLAAAAVLAPLSAYEEPVFQVLERSDSFELRLYSPQVVAETEVSGEFREASNAAFRRLFGYISGGNTGKTAIAMTIPVTMQQQGLATDAASTPTGTYRMRFVVPDRFTLADAPAPSDPTITLHQLPSQRVAVRTYSGRANHDNYRVEEQALLADLAKRGLTPTGTAMMAVFNGPFTPPFLRRNEVQIPVADPVTAQR